MVDSFIVDILMTCCSLDESDPLKFISTELLPDSNSLNLHGSIGHFQIRTQDLIPIPYTLYLSYTYFTHWLANKFQKIFETTNRFLGNHVVPKVSSSNLTS